LNDRTICEEISNILIKYAEVAYDIKIISKRCCCIHCSCPM